MSVRRPRITEAQARRLADRIACEVFTGMEGRTGDRCQILLGLEPIGAWGETVLASTIRHILAIEGQQAKRKRKLT